METFKFQILSVALFAILLAPAAVEAVCGRCKNSHACISETQFQLCFDGVRDQSQTFTCPSERAICTDYIATCVANSTRVVRGCGDAAACAVCPDVNTKFACTSRNTFAACSNQAITSYTQTCKDNYVCSAASAATGTPCVSHCKGDTGDVCDLPGQLSADEEPIQSTVGETSPVTTVSTSDDSTVTTVNPPTETTGSTTVDPTTDSSTETTPTDSDSDSTSTSTVNTSTETTPTTVTIPTETSPTSTETIPTETSPTSTVDSSTETTPTTVNTPTDTTPTTVNTPTDSTPTTENTPTDSTPTTNPSTPTTNPSTDSTPTDTTPTTVNTPTETTPTTADTPTETTPTTATPTTEATTTQTTLPPETVYCQGISTAGRYAIPGDTVCTSYINCVFRENSWKGLVYNCIASKPYFNATAFGCGTTKPSGPGCT